MGLIAVPLTLIAFGIMIALIENGFPKIHFGPKYYDKEGKEKKE
jgi:hypothetical protein